MKDICVSFSFIILILVAVVAGNTFIKKSVLGARVDKTSYQPRNVNVTNIESDSMTINWTTQESTLGYVMFGPSPNSLKNTKYEKPNKKSVIHTVDIDNLTPSTKYHFSINSESDLFDNSGIPWNVTTSSSITSSTPLVVSGEVVSKFGLPVASAFVQATPVGGTTLSTTTNNRGQFVITISKSKANDLGEYLKISPKSLVEISVYSPSHEMSYAKVNVESSNPMPPIILGSLHDFSNLSLISEDHIPDATINLPVQ